jgi:hypothetical protein
MNRPPHIHSAHSDRQEEAAEGVPIVLPRLVFRAQNDAEFALTVHGVDHIDDGSLRPAGRRPVVGRSELGTVVASLAEQAGTAVRVEIHERDGTVHADIIEPPPSQNRTSSGASGGGGWAGAGVSLPASRS